MPCHRKISISRRPAAKPHRFPADLPAPPAHHDCRPGRHFVHFNYTPPIAAAFYPLSIHWTAVYSIQVGVARIACGAGGGGSIRGDGQAGMLVASTTMSVGTARLTAMFVGFTTTGLKGRP